jgi:diguanylate cyclase (GGDEF)-like protein
MSLRARILLLVLLATLAPAVVVGFIQFGHRNSDIEDAKRSLGALAKYAAENLDDKVKGTVQLLHGLSRAPDIDTTDKAACSEFLAGVLARYPQYTGLLTITPNGDLHCDSLRSGRRLNLTGRAYFKQVSASLEPAFDVVFGGLTGIAVLQVAYPVLDSYGTLKYVLLASLNLSQYAQGFAAASQYTSIRILIWDRTGSLMVRKPDAGGASPVGKDFAASALFRFAASGNAGTAAELPDVDGAPRVWALGVMPEPRGGGARITLGIPRSVLVAEANSSLRNALAILIAVSLLAFTGAWYVAESGIRRHVRRIATVAGRVGAGDLDARIGAPYPSGELGELMAVVDRTSSAVQAQQLELESSSRGLQRANRTFRMLSAINSLIVRAGTRQELLEGACRIAVGNGGYGIAWIGKFDPATLDVTPVAWTGVGPEQFTRKTSARPDTGAGQGALGCAIRERKPVFVNDMTVNPAVGGQRREEAIRRGYRSLIALPLYLSGEVFGNLSLFTKELNFFDSEEVALLTELAGNISFALEFIEHKEKIDRLSRIRVVTSAITTAIIHVHDPQTLFQEACRIAVEQGRLGSAWIGSLDRATLDITPVAWAGEGSEEMRTTKSTARDDPPRGQGAVSRAVRERRVVLNNDLSLQNFGGPRLQAMLTLGFRSMIALPLFQGDAVVGTFTLYAREPGFFDEDEIRLLTEMTGDISFALDHMARQQRIEKLSRIRSVSSEINAAIVRSRTRQILFYEACRIAVEHGKFGIAWVGELDPEKLEVTPVATTGLEESGFIMHTVLSVRADGPHGAGTLPRAVRERRPVFSNDITVNPEAGGDRRKEAIRRGYHSAIVLPLIVDGAVTATFSMFAKELNYFDDEEVGLLTELAANLSFALDNIERKEKIARLSRIEAVMGSISGLIVRAVDRDELFREACRIAVDEGRFRMSLIGIVDRSTLKIVPVASAGKDQELLTSIKCILSSSENASKTMVARAIRDKKAVVSNDSQSDSAVLFGKKYAESGVHSMAVLPLIVSDEAVGVLALYSEENGFFDDEEMRLLTELTGNIAFAIDHIAKQERLDYLAYYDALTGLANRALFLERVAQSIRSASSGGHKLALFLVDLDRFKNINDTLGRTAGDALLKEVAAWFTSHLGGANLLARVGSDHFAALMPEAKEEGDVARLIEKSMDAFLKHPFRLRDAVFRIAAKVGVALFPDDGADADTLFRNAEAALKKAKSSGERYLFYTQKMTEAVAGKLALENQLREALDKEEFVLHYQPKINLASGAVCGLEALIRWQKPGAGLVSPATFIPLLEETGLILGVGKWALSKALSQHREWTARGIAAPRIAVNVSAIQLQQKDFSDVVIDALQAQDGDPDALELEVTESLLMQDVQESFRKLSILRGLGIHIAMDDFGTGYSSLSYIVRLPLNSLKIDRSFITGMASSPQDMGIVTTIIALAHSLNLRVVAEGVETKEQSQLLKLLRCDEAQGYLFSKPLPAAQLVKLLGGTAAVGAGT